MKITLLKNLALAKTNALRAIDAAAERERLRYITAGSGQAMVYKAKQDEAARFVLSGEIGPLMAAEVGVTAPTVQELAQIWLNMQSLWIYAATQIEVKRLTAKSAVEAAANPAAIDAATNIDWTLS